MVRIASCVLALNARMAAEGGLEIITAERQEQMAQGVHRRSPPEAGAKDRVQALALQGDEGDDPLIGGGTRQHGKDREQQQMAHAIALPLPTTGITHIGKRGEQGSKRYQGDLHKQESRLHRSVTSRWRRSPSGG